MIGKNYSSLSLQPSYINRTMSDISDAIQAKCLAFGDRIIKLNDYLLAQAVDAHEEYKRSKLQKKEKTSSISHQTSSILPMNVEADFIKKALDAGLYKQAIKITSSIQLQTSAFVHRTKAFLHI